MKPAVPRVLGCLLLGAALVNAVAKPAAQPKPPPEVTGTVTRVVDGDTFWFKPADGGEAMPVRIQGIDAPERCQAWGPEATEALKSRLLAQAVTLRISARDDYGRTVAKVYLADADVADRLVRDGHAWSDHQRNGRGPYLAEERMATALHRGLHAERGAVLPRDFRRQNGACPP